VPLRDIWTRRPTPPIERTADAAAHRYNRYADHSELGSQAQPEQPRGSKVLKTDLRDVLLRTWSVPGEDLHAFPHEDLDYETLHRAVLESRCSKMLNYVGDSSSLWDLAPAGLILTDAFLLSGFGKEDCQFPLPTHEMLKLVMEGGGEKLRSFAGVRDGVARIPTYGMFSAQTLSKWLTDAQLFIEDGRLGYLPAGVRACSPLVPIEGNTESQGLAMRASFEIELDLFRWAGEDAQIVEIDGADTEEVTSFDVEVLSLSIPYISGLSLPLLHKVLVDEEDALVRFRKVFFQFVHEYEQKARDVGLGDVLDRTVRSLRRDIIEPELALLNQKFNRVLKSRALKVAGAALGTVALTGAAALSSGLGQAVSVALGR
jgi:hypothetical protein